MKDQIFFAAALAALTLSSCSQELFNAPGREEADGSGRIQLAGEINQVETTRVNDDGFADGDVMGVYIVDYNANNPGTLLSKGNRGDNVRHTFDEAGYRWSSAYDLYWKDKHTRIDVYGYYPFGSPDDVNNYKFSVKTNQASIPGDGSMGDYEASDFLWGKVEGVEPTSNVIRLPLTHRMANARVTLTEGSGFADGEWADLDKQVLVANTIRDAVIDLSTGSVTASGSLGAQSIIPTRRDDEWRAIVVPQSVPAGTTMFSLTIGGMPYRFSRSDDFTYLPGKMSNFTIRVDKKEPTGDYALTLVSESITAWETDMVSHDATSKEYVIVESAPGRLKQAITDAGKDYRALKNLKITGEIDSRDFYFMRDEMDALQALNLKEVKIQAFGNEPIYNIACNEDQIPPSAFYYNSTVSGKKSLTRIILPDRLKSIGARAFYGCQNLTGSLIIPEGVIDIQQGAFHACRSLTGSLSLPSTLKYIGNSQHDDGVFSEDKDEGIDYYGGVFSNCGFTCELIIPDNVELIRGYAFDNCKGLYGNLRLPEKLKRLGDRAFFLCLNLSGSLEIPQGVTDIPSEAFTGCGFDGTLTLHDGIATIGNDAFSGCHFRGELALPKNLMVVNDGVFYGCDFSGELVLPKGLVTIGDKAFAYNWRLMGNLEFAEGLITIGAGAFAHCRSLEGLVFPESLENIRYEASYNEDGGAFQGCYGIVKMVSRSQNPPYIQQGAFDGVAKDNFTLEVPESSVAQYQTAAGWCDFKRIAAHHELVCRPSVACALGTEHKQTLVIDAEGDWVLESKPDWCELSQKSGSKKSDVTLTIKSTGAGDIREGDVVFRLKDKDYTHTCHVSQYGYEYGEDQYLTLQKATKGNNGGIDIVILGDGYDAKDMASGEYLKDMKMQVENFFGIEPYTTYRDYFNVYTAFPLSTESGVGTINSIRYNRFGTTYTGGVGLKCDYDMLTDYVLKAPTVNEGNIDRTLVIVVPNSTDYGGICQMWSTGYAIAFCPKSDYGYPLDTRGVIQHEAGGHGFGKLADEYIYHNAFIDACDCTCCGHVDAINWGKSLGWYDNISLTGKMHEVGWSHLIFDRRYSDIVDIFEGGFMHNRGVFRSEHNSCMNNNIPYYSTISRQSIVKRIKAYAGEPFDFEEFVALDKRTSQAVTRSLGSASGQVHSHPLAPVIHKGSPLKKK
ncbi:MAG: leucine-rich repeat protein [Muribaculaceae bacterium]|nr:leucine-rich repeat protein [Muribaculaceae bacterium]